jgi:hypothetical protein
MYFCLVKVAVYLPYSPDLTLLGLLEKNASDDNITPVMRCCKKLCSSGCGGGRATFTGHVYLLLFKCGGSLSTKMETTLKINCALNNVVMNFCGIFMCPASKKIT